NRKARRSALSWYPIRDPPLGSSGPECRRSEISLGLQLGLQLTPMDAIRPKPFVNPLAEVIDFRAEANGSDYELRIGLPMSYPQGGSQYPLLIVLDADLAFGTTHETSMIEALWSAAPLGNQAARVPEVIVVGIALPDRPLNPFRRNFEYMPDANP